MSQLTLFDAVREKMEDTCPRVRYRLRIPEELAWNYLLANATRIAKEHEIKADDLNICTFGIQLEALMTEVLIIEPP